MYKLAFLLSIYRFISHHLSHPLQALLLLYQINRFLFAQLNDTEVICRFTPPTFPQPLCCKPRRCGEVGRRAVVVGVVARV